MFYSLTNKSGQFGFKLKFIELYYTEVALSKHVQCTIMQQVFNVYLGTYILTKYDQKRK